VFCHFLFVGAPGDVSNEMGTGKRVCRELKLPAPAYWQAVRTGQARLGNPADLPVRGRRNHRWPCREP
jgi:hypothetical protein